MRWLEGVVVEVLVAFDMPIAFRAALGKIFDLQLYPGGQTRVSLGLAPLANAVCAWAAVTAIKIKATDSMLATTRDEMPNIFFI